MSYRFILILARGRRCRALESRRKMDGTPRLGSWGTQTNDGGAQLRRSYYKDGKLDGNPILYILAMVSKDNK
jgi:hypothetical protein